MGTTNGTHGSGKEAHAGGAWTRRPLTPAQAAFAEALAAGRTRSDAYRCAYPASRAWAARTVWRKASILATHAGVRAAVKAAAKVAADRSVNTLAAHLRTLDQLSHAAEDAGNYAAAVRAEECRGRAAGFYGPEADRFRAGVVAKPAGRPWNP